MGKGKGKEYNFKLRFEGEYLNGKRWNEKGYDPFNNNIYILKDGKGYVKFYNTVGKFEFEGEYLNGQKNGKGKEYYNRSNMISKRNEEENDDFVELIFEGEYLNGKRWNGKGKEYDSDCKLLFDVEYLNGIKSKI